MVDASVAVSAVHQNHDDGHVAGEKPNRGIEERRNRELGGERLEYGYTSWAPWELGERTLVERKK